MNWTRHTYSTHFNSSIPLRNVPCFYMWPLLILYNDNETITLYLKFGTNNNFKFNHSIIRSCESLWTEECSSFALSSINPSPPLLSFFFVLSLHLIPTLSMPVIAILGFRLLVLSAPHPPGTPLNTTSLLSEQDPPAYLRQYAWSKCVAKTTPIYQFASSRKVLKLVSQLHLSFG